MALHDVLGLLSKAIRSDASPEEVAEMIATTRALSDAERSDLAQIPFERLSPYQHDIYMAERNMLVWGFGNVWRCLQQLRFGNATTDTGDQERAFLLRFKREYPCATHSVREMGALFVKFLARDHAELCAAHPWLLELAEAERLEIEVLYAMDSTLGHALGEAERAALFAQPVGDLLSAQIVRAERVHVGAYAHDITAIKREVDALRGDDDLLDFQAAPFQPAGTPLHFGIARDHETLEPTWYFADAADAAFVAATSEQSPRSIESHAEAVIKDLARTDDAEETQLTLYLQRLERALRLRYLLLV